MFSKSIEIQKSFNFILWGMGKGIFCGLGKSLRPFIVAYRVCEPHTFHPREAFNGVTLKVTRPLKLQNGSFGISFNPFWPLTYLFALAARFLLRCFLISKYIWVLKNTNSRKGKTPMAMKRNQLKLIEYIGSVRNSVIFKPILYSVVLSMVVSLDEGSSRVPLFIGFQTT